MAQQEIWGPESNPTSPTEGREREREIGEMGSKERKGSQGAREGKDGAREGGREDYWRKGWGLLG